MHYCPIKQVEYFVPYKNPAQTPAKEEIRLKSKIQSDSQSHGTFQNIQIYTKNSIQSNFL